MQWKIIEYHIFILKHQLTIPLFSIFSKYKDFVYRKVMGRP